MQSNLNCREDSKVHSDITNSSIKCHKCGKRVAVMHDQLVCKRCGTLVFKRKKDEFKFRMREQLRKGR